MHPRCEICISKADLLIMALAHLLRRRPKVRAKLGIKEGRLKL